MDALDRKIRRFLVDEGYLFPTTDAEIERALEELKPKISRVSKAGITTHYEAFCPVCNLVIFKAKRRKSLNAYMEKRPHVCGGMPDPSVFIYK